MNTQQCPYCNGDRAYATKTLDEYPTEIGLVWITNVPIFLCLDCKGTVIDSDISDRLDELHDAIAKNYFDKNIVLIDFEDENTQHITSSCSAPNSGDNIPASEVEDDVCPDCQSELIKEEVGSHKYTRKGCFLLVENVPRVKCFTCDQVFLDATTLYRLEDIKDSFIPPANVSDKDVIAVNYNDPIIHPDTGYEVEQLTFPASLEIKENLKDVITDLERLIQKDSTQEGE